MNAVPVVVVALIATLAISMILAIGIGAVAVTPGTIWDIIIGKLLGQEEIDGIPRNVVQIVWELRAPRVVLAAILGAALSVVGVAMQVLVRNPLADPYVLGASSGASVGATLVILFGSFGLGSLGISLAAFVTSALTMAVVYLIAQEGGRLTPMRLVLSGVVIGYVLSAITSLLVFWGDPRAAQQVLFWLLGGLGRARWAVLWLPATVLLVVALRMMMISRQLDAMHAGDEAATTLGVPIAWRRAELFVITALLTGVMVAISGAVGFIGLVIPHITRLLVGGLHVRVVPISLLFGALFMVWVDVFARWLIAPQEIPAGVLTAIIGGPLFLALMRRRGRTQRGLG
ncbi:FecCD family ABC transporter permease [Granulosicoccus antarcticus]|uniref:FecCD family ABC transporter permease n=1 Tax=Granulosicoccus antarcticus TaxID=437505 RepID=UPI00197A7028|nr:iron ABC transporter permease [Granulosicoccus antarcticus]